jgi:hypothetical protein
MAISGIGTTAIAAGSLLVYSAVTDQSLTAALRGVLKGELKPPGEQPAKFVESGGSSPIGGPLSPGGQGGFVQAALRYVGRQYVWGGTFSGNGGGDCSGLVYRAYQDIGINAPRLTAAGFSMWRTQGVSTPAAGDLLYWVGHIAIVVNDTQMVEAPTFGVPVRVVPIRPGAVVRRYVPPQSSTPARGRTAI